MNFEKGILSDFLKEFLKKAPQGVKGSEGAVRTQPREQEKTRFSALKERQEESLSQRSVFAPSGLIPVGIHSPGAAIATRLSILAALSEPFARNES